MEDGPQRRAIADPKNFKIPQGEGVRARLHPSRSSSFAFRGSCRGWTGTRAPSVGRAHGEEQGASRELAPPPPRSVCSYAMRRRSQCVHSRLVVVSGRRDQDLRELASPAPTHAHLRRPGKIELHTLQMRTQVGRGGGRERLLVLPRHPQPQRSGLVPLLSNSSPVSLLSLPRPSMMSVLAPPLSSLRVSSASCFFFRKVSCPEMCISDVRPPAAHRLSPIPPSAAHRPFARELQQIAEQRERQDR